jgi:DNA-binding MarR family transcriptional regulator
MPRPISQVARAIKQGRPFPSLAQEGTVGLLVVADRLRRIIEPALEPHGITGQQYNVLRILRGAGTGGLPTLEIAARMIEQAPGVTRLLDRLEAKKLVRRERCQEDRRQVLCYITPAGRTLIDGLDAEVERLDRGALGMLSRKQQEQLVNLLNAVLAGPA